MKKLFFSIVVILFSAITASAQTTPQLEFNIHGELVRVTGNPLPWDDARQSIKAVDGYTQHAASNGDQEALFYQNNNVYSLHFDGVAKKWDLKSIHCFSCPVVSSFVKGAWIFTETKDFAKN